MLRFAEALQVFELFVVARDQTTLIGHIADGAGEFAFRGFQVRFCGGDIRLRASHIIGDRADFGVAFGSSPGRFARQACHRWFSGLPESCKARLWAAPLPPAVRLTCWEVTSSFPRRSAMRLVGLIEARGKLCGLVLRFGKISSVRGKLRVGLYIQHKPGSQCHPAISQTQNKSIAGYTTIAAARYPEC